MSSFEHHPNIIHLRGKSFNSTTLHEAVVMDQSTQGNNPADGGGGNGGGQGPDHHGSSERSSTPTSSIMSESGIFSPISTAPTVDHITPPNHASKTLKERIIEGLTQKDVLNVPGNNKEEDSKWAYHKNLPTEILYSEEGLALYSTMSTLPTYYPYHDELSLFKKYGDEIACRILGYPASVLQGQNDDKKNGIHQDQKYQGPNIPSQSKITKTVDINDRWGDYEVGRNNHGVNGHLSYGDPVNTSQLQDRAPPQTNGAGVQGAAGTVGCPREEEEAVVKKGLKGMVIELGAGSLTKTSHLLQSLSKLFSATKDGGGLDPNNLFESDGQRPTLLPVESLKYFALDLEPGQLRSTLTELGEKHSAFVTTADLEEDGELQDQESYRHKVVVQGLCADYDEGLGWIAHGGLDDEEDEEKVASGDNESPSTATTTNPRCILHLGSSLGNFAPSSAIEFLSRISTLLRPGVDKLLIGIDSCNDKETVQTAYGDPEGITADWVKLGWRNAENVLGLPEGGLGEVEYRERWNEGEGRHEAYLQVQQDKKINLSFDQNQENDVAIDLKRGELMSIECSYKWTRQELGQIFEGARLRIVQRWSTEEDGNGRYSLYLLERSPLGWHQSQEARPGYFSVDATSRADKGFAAGKANQATPSLDEFKALARSWDTVTLDVIPRDQLLAKPIELRNDIIFYLGHIPVFADMILNKEFHFPATRDKAGYYAIFERGIDPDVMTGSIHRHSEAPPEWPPLEDILAFRDGFRDRVAALFESEEDIDRAIARALFVAYEHEGLHLETLLYMVAQMQPAKICNPPGFTVPDFASLSKQWDKDVSQRKGPLEESFSTSIVYVGHDDDDRDDHKPLDPTHEFGWDNEHPRREISVPGFKINLLPISNDEYFDFFVQRGKPFDLFPPSWSELPSGEVAVKTIYGSVPLEFSKHWPLMASGFQLAEFAKSKGGRLPTEGELRSFFDKYPVWHPGNNGAGFENWHPLPPTLPLKNRDGTHSLSNGGIFEWTSTIFDKHEGFLQSRLYPEYSVDFFRQSDKVDHSVVLGGSWATIPRIAKRRAFRNWYQEPYGFAFAGGRIVWA